MKEVEVVKTYKYLETIISKQKEESIEIKVRIAIINRSHFFLLSIFRNKVIFPKTEIRIYKTLTKPVLVYGSEKWTLTKRIEEMLLICERKIL